MEGPGSLLALAMLICSLWLVFWFCILLPMRMATARGRSAAGWLFISLVFSPLFAIVMLMVLGEARR